jgi:hypothetical protein
LTLMCQYIKFCADCLMITLWQPCFMKFRTCSSGWKLSPSSA